LKAAFSNINAPGNREYVAENVGNLLKICKGKVNVQELGVITHGIKKLREIDDQIRFTG
jgi:hypothetical protein